MICGKYGIQTHFKGGRTIKNLLVSSKDKDPMVNQSGAIYWYQCGDLGCDLKAPQLFIIIAAKQATPPTTITSKY